MFDRSAQNHNSPLKGLGVLAQAEGVEAVVACELAMQPIENQVRIEICRLR